MDNFTASVQRNISYAIIIAFLGMLFLSVWFEPALTAADALKELTMIAVGFWLMRQRGGPEPPKAP